jgi:hypothetical protein
MQKLFVKQGDEMKEIHVLRSWQDISGRQIFLHHNGVYGYKDGTPVKNITEFDIMPIEHRQQAVAWWKRGGQKLSADHYAEQEKKVQEKAGDFQAMMGDGNTALDSVLYTRRSKKGGAVSAPRSWMEWFEKRPDWWGQATHIQFNDYIYTMIAVEEVTAQTIPAPGSEEREANPNAEGVLPKEARPTPGSLGFLGDGKKAGF